MLFLDGPPAYSRFRLDKLAETIAAQVPALQSLSAHCVHLVLLADDGAGELSPADRRKLDELLDYGPRRTASPADAASLVVTPRIGTRSPWSTKATDIAHRCGLGRIARLERGVAWKLHGADPAAAFSERDFEVFARHLHDPMTESVFLSRSAAEALFEQSPPAPLKSVDLLQRGRQALVEANAAWGLALSDEEIDYLLAQYRRLDRDPTDAE
ncbi:MAG TPA: hypothetical protein VK973_03090, partial [Arenicellales bacterium]|nr:hypothetical protein [Arenicellales bacterium]